MGNAIARHKTAMARSALSRPLATAIADGLLSEDEAIFDYGCGRGEDIRQLRALGYRVDGWDPSYRPWVERSPSDVVNLGYVVNVIEEPIERAATLRSAWSLATRLLIVSARMEWDGRDLIGRQMGDGILTRSGTFQKFFQQAELAEWIERTLDVQPHAGAPGIFYVFRDPMEAQRYVASRVYTYRPRLRVAPRAQYEANEEVLQPLMGFMRDHARAPRKNELTVEAFVAIEQALGSLGRAHSLLRRVTEKDYWDKVSVHRRAELLIYVALSRFGRRPKFSELDYTIGADLRALFGNYQRACIEADRLLLACGDEAMIYFNARSSKVGKQTPSALYVHRSAMAEIPPILQVYEGCARVLAGTVEGANLIKLSVKEPQVSYLSYPDFDRNPHPALASSVTVNLRRTTVEIRDYSKSENPPILHRKEEFLGPGDLRRPRYERLTRAEMRAGLYAHPESIGNLVGWTTALRSAGFALRGHRLERRDCEDWQKSRGATSRTPLDGVG